MDFTAISPRDLLRAAPDPTVIVDTDGRIVLVSDRVADVFGYEPGELLGQPIETLVPERHRVVHRNHRASYADAPHPRPMGLAMELYGRRKDGSEFPVEISLSPVRTPQGMLISSTVRDVSERRRIEDALRRAQHDAERANLSKSRFLAAASHDLRQPLQSLGLYLSVLNRHVDGDKAAEISMKMRKSLDTMGELLDALLDISRFESGSVVPEVQDLLIATLLDRIVTDNVQQAEDKGLELQCVLSDCVVRTDPGLLERVLENLVTNAIRYTEAGSVTIDCEPVENCCRIRISDTGIGIPRDALEHIFDEYYQLDNPIRDRRKGLGLGLSIVRHIARVLGLELRVDSRLGEGSTFIVEVPLGECRPQPAEEERMVPHQSKREPLVLFVEDDPAVVDATTMLFEDVIARMATAVDGQAAVDAVAGGLVPDLIVSDYRLPGMNGVEVIRRVREILGREVPAVIMTGDTSARDIETAGLGRCTVLHKPVDTDRLLGLVEESLAAAREGSAG